MDERGLVRGRWLGVLGPLLLALLVAPIWAGCGDSPVAEAQPGEPKARRLRVHASNRPLGDFARRLGGESVEVVAMAPPGVDPADWSPAPEQVAGMQSADLILLQGAGYEAWLDRVSLPRRRLIVTTAGFADRLLPVPAATVHTHGPEGAHSHVERSATTWLDPELAILQAGAVAAALSEALPDQKDAIAARLAALETALTALDARLREAASRLAGAPILFSHPVYPYLQARYGLNGRSLHWEPGTLPDESEWLALDAVRVEHRAFLMIWERSPLDESRRALAERGIESVVFDPAGAAASGTEQSWLELMEENAGRLSEAAERLGAARS
jgi:zinc transport system substrate-binding protein